MTESGILVGKIIRSAGDFLVGIKADNIISQGDQLRLEDHGFQGAELMTIGGEPVGTVFPGQEFELKISAPCLFGAIARTLERQKDEATGSRRPSPGIKVFLHAGAQRKKRDAAIRGRQPVLAGT